MEEIANKKSLGSDSIFGHKVMKTRRERGKSLREKEFSSLDKGNPLSDQGIPCIHKGNPLLDQGNLFNRKGNPLSDQGIPSSHEGNPLFDQGNPCPHQGNLFNYQGIPLSTRKIPAPARKFLEKKRNPFSRREIPA